MAEKHYKIGEAAELLNLKTYVLRFWEMEFSQIAPTRTPTGQRLYTERDMVVLKRVKHLLHERGLTIEGARRQLLEEERKVQHASSLPSVEPQSLIEICALEKIGQNEFEFQEQHAMVVDAPGQTFAATEPKPMCATEMLCELRLLRDMLAGNLSAASYPEGSSDKPEEPER